MELEMNWIAILLAALSTFITGFIWYHPKTFGSLWMRESGMTEEKMKGVNKPLFFGLSLVYAILIAFIINFLTIHQWGAVGMIGGKYSEALSSYTAFMNDYGTKFRTFKHGALHGFMAGILLAFPLIATNAMYERRSFKYTLVTSGFWIVCFTLMGAILCGMPK